MALGLIDPNTIQRDADAIKKAKETKASATISDFSLIREKLKNHLNEYDTFMTADQLHDYIDYVIDKGMCGIDTETTGLDPILNNIVGFSMYVPGRRACYIPLYHISNITFMPVPGQMSVDVVKQELQRAQDSGVKWIYHNYVFDRRVIKNHVGVALTAYWDTQKAWRYLNENESSKLKVLNQKYLDSGDEEALTFESLFDGITFDKVPIDVATLYAAGDPVKTWNLYEFEEKIFSKNEQLPHLRDTFLKIEMPVQTVIADMEDKGVYFDDVECEKMRKSWEENLNIKRKEIDKIVEKDSGKILAYTQKHPTTAIKYPLNTSSPKQVSTYLYDVLGCPTGKNGKGTGEDELKRIDNEFCRALLGVRGLEKIYSTYLVALPRAMNPKTHRVHTRYNSYGAATGRMSSSNPNMQNIPSKHNEIRNVFIAPEGKVLISSDYSQQEPRLLAYCSQDPGMLGAYNTGKDIYSWMASLVYNMKYEDCLEHNPDGTTNPDGYKRRKSMKSVILGIMYGMSSSGLADDLHIGRAEAQKILDDFAKAFPSVDSWVSGKIAEAKKTGYVQTVWGRKRRLPSLRLPEFQLEPMEGYTQVSDVLDFDAIASGDVKDGISDDDYNYFMRKLVRCRGYKQKAEIVSEAKSKQIRVIDNGGKIADAQRQAINSIIQGSAADMTKWAMIKIHNNQDLQRLGAELIIQVHDEVIVECPEENKEEAGKILQKCMLEAASDMIDVPMKCDVSFAKRWGDI